MRRIYIRGLVSLADTVRRELSQPIHPAGLNRLRCDVATAIGDVDTLLAKRSRRLSALPAPSRKAYLYLRRLDWRSVRTGDAPTKEKHPPGTVRFVGLRSHFDGLLDRLGCNGCQGDLEEAYASICETGEKLQHRMQADDIAPEHLTPESRNMMAWLAYFRKRNNFDAYQAAVSAARPLMERAARVRGRFSPAVVVHFRPMNGLYRIRGFADSTRVRLPTPMISFDAEGFVALAGVLFGRKGNREAVIRRTFGAPYAAVRTALDQLCGEVDLAAGAFYDLAASFERVNAAYFSSEMPRPRLTWSRQVTGYKFGHFDHAHDTLMVSCSLDSPDVPAYVVDFLVYHELLHRKHGARWKNGRQAFHTPQFRRREKQFEQYAQAQTVLTQLAKRYS